MNIYGTNKAVLKQQILLGERGRERGVVNRVLGSLVALAGDGAELAMVAGGCRVDGDPARLGLHPSRMQLLAQVLHRPTHTHTNTQ